MAHGLHGQRPRPGVTAFTSQRLVHGTDSRFDLISSRTTSAGLPDSILAASMSTVTV